MSEETMVQTTELTKKYGAFTALDSLTISVERGGILGFIGPNGAGKTTTIKILVGLARASSGTATICGAVCGVDTARTKRLVGYMPDVFGAYDNMRVREYLDFFGAAFKIPRRGGERARRIDECLELTGASHMRDLFVEALSHGMKQRVALTRTMLHDPQVLILDEPANGLDPQARVEMRQTLLRLAEMGKALIVTSHILPELARICTRVAIITRGKLRAFGTLEEIMRTMPQERVMEVVLADRRDVQPAEETLRRRLGSRTVIHASPAAAEVRFETGMTDGELTEVLSGLCQAGVGVVQFREVQRDLEDAFLSVTAKERAAENGVAADAASGLRPTEEHVS